ncbi:hypothetical protein [Gluconobacter oxydans]|uniref:hypothetical protein n=1 Tax=Gluconobacter oxydans TaxID=442 RepID=UPI003464D6B8
MMPDISAHDLVSAAELLLQVQEIAYRIGHDPGAAQDLRRLSFQCGEAARSLKGPTYTVQIPIAA